MMEMLIPLSLLVFEGDELNNKASAAVEKRIHGDPLGPSVSIQEKRAEV